LFRPEGAQTPAWIISWSAEASTGCAVKSRMLRRCLMARRMGEGMGMGAGRMVMIGNEMIVWNTLKFQENHSRSGMDLSNGFLWPGYVAQEIKTC